MRAVAVVAAVLAALPLSISAADAASDASGAQQPRELFFPVAAPFDLSDTWRAPRSNGRTHEGSDIMAAQMTPVYAARSGVISRVWGEGCSAGQYCTSFALVIIDDDGQGQMYLHLNDDTPGRPSGCDHRGGMGNAFSPALVDRYAQAGTLVGMRVTAGQHIGYVGSSGNAGCGVDHLHFEWWADDRYGNEAGKYNPYPSLQAALDQGRHFAGAFPHERDPALLDRLSGPDRVATSVAAAQAGWPDGPQDGLLLATADLPQPALIAAALAGGDRPVLLTWAPQTGVLEPEVADLVEGRAVTVVGVDGQAQRLQAAAEAAGASSVQVFSGGDVPSLAANVARQFAQPAQLGLGRDQVAEVLVVRTEHPDADRAWPDAVSGSPYAALRGAPVVAVTSQGLPPASRELLTEFEVVSATIIGGTAAVSQQVSDELEQQFGVRVRRLSGPDRFATSSAVAQDLVDGGLSAKRVLVTTGVAFPDALAAGPLAARWGRPLLLVAGQLSTSAVESQRWLADRAESGRGVTVVGGPAAVGWPTAHLTARWAGPVR